MQNRYTGDVGDFGKLGMLRAIASTGMKIGINWYLVPDEGHNEDGKHTGYITNKDFASCDDRLLAELRKIVFENNRSISALEHADILPDAVYYNNVLYPPRTQDQFSRKRWHEEGLKLLANCDLVFMDPDNGLLLNNDNYEKAKSNKFVYKEEIIDYYLQGNSVIFYNHRCRLKEDVYLNRFVEFRDNAAFKGAEWLVLKYSRGTIRDYFFILQPEHASKVRTAVENLLSGKFKMHFERLYF